MNTSNHWQYYLTLEDDFRHSFRYVEPCKMNEHTYSVEYVRLLLAIGSEVDVVLKQICTHFGRQGNNIEEYQKAICSSNTGTVLKTAVKMYEADFKQITPWNSWFVASTPTSPAWWKSYNDVKHKRSENFSKASFKNVRDGLAGLFLACVQLGKLEGVKELIPPSALFDTDDRLALRVLPGEGGRWGMAIDDQELDRIKNWNPSSILIHQQAPN